LFAGKTGALRHICSRQRAARDPGVTPGERR